MPYKNDSEKNWKNMTRHIYKCQMSKTTTHTKTPMTNTETPTNE